MFSLCRRALWFFPICGLVILVWVAYAQKADPPTEKKPQETGLRPLGAPEVVEGYRLQPPQNFTSLPPMTEDEADRFAWLGPERKDGTRSVLLLQLIPLSQADAKALTLDKAANVMLAGVKRARTHWTQT